MEAQKQKSPAVRQGFDFLMINHLPYPSFFCGIIMVGAMVKINGIGDHSIGKNGRVNENGLFAGHPPHPE
jgi:hypothetical protein